MRRHMLPFVEPLLAGLADHTLAMAIDGSAVGRHCLALMVSLIYHKHAIHLLWVVVQGRRRRFPDPNVCGPANPTPGTCCRPDASLVLLGDGEFDSVELQTFLAQAHWDYVCRPPRAARVYQEGAWQALG